jgi:hypothetical protein
MSTTFFTSSVFCNEDSQFTETSAIGHEHLAVQSRLPKEVPIHGTPILLAVIFNNFGFFVLFDDNNPLSNGIQTFPFCLMEGIELLLMSHD